jgi:undecaprenyl-diphosphatase
MLVMFFFSCIPLLFLLLPVGNDMKLMDWLSGFSEDDSILLEGFCFLFTGCLLLSSTYVSKKNKLTREVNTLEAFAVGIAQVFAAGFPGISRSGSTISTGMICGVSKDYMVEYSFILGIPAILVANAVELKDAVESGAQLELLPTIVGVIVAAVVGVACIKLLQWILKKDMWKYFGYYCLVLGAVTVVCSAFGL